MAALPDGSGFVSGSADHDVKFWEWEVAADPETGAKQLGISHTRCAGAGLGRVQKGLLGGGGVLRLSLGWSVKGWTVSRQGGYGRAPATAWLACILYPHLRPHY